MNTENGFQRTARLVVLFLAAGLGQPALTRADTNAVDPALFKDSPAEYRGICWMGFNLSSLTETGVVARVQSSARSDSWGSFVLGPGGGPTDGFVGSLSERVQAQEKRSRRSDTSARSTSNFTGWPSRRG